MGIDVQLRDELGEVLAQVGDERSILSRAVQAGKLGQAHLLRYLSPWGDAIFNQAQAGDLMIDVRRVIGENRGSPLAEVLARVEPLVERLGREVHLYLWFVGD